MGEGNSLEISAEKTGLSGEQKRYLDLLQNTINYLDQEFPYNYWVVGGLAKEAYLNNSNFETTSKRGNLRDLDIIVEKGRVGAFEKIRKNSPTQIPMGAFLNRYVFLDSSSCLLKLGNKSTEVPRSVFQTKQVELFGVEFPTFPPETLFHLYCVRGSMRTKDFSSALSIGRYMRNSPSPELSENLYQPFHRFSKEARDKDTHPQVIMEKLAEWYTNTPLGEKIPLNSKALKPVALHIWDAAGLRTRK